ncbi:hypothetical protein [Streptomyces misionensis]|uniref:hypothetical protein n=1 Tax=Streptomyces misionensis TaxID=67331 RepID=UPI0033B46B94
MQPLPTPCPADLVPDATGQDAFNAAYRAAMQQRAVFVAVECQAQRWTVKADALTAFQHDIDATVYDAVRNAVIRLIRSREIRPDSSAGPVYFVLYERGPGARTRRRTARGAVRRPPPPGPGRTRHPGLITTSPLTATCRGQRRRVLAGYLSPGSPLVNGTPQRKARREYANRVSNLGQ